MKEDTIFYILGCFRYASAFFHKNNYKKHEPLHAEISGRDGLLEIEETLMNPDCVTEYAQKNALGQVIKKTEVYYRKIAKRNTFRDKPVTDHWKASFGMSIIGTGKWPARSFEAVLRML